MPRLGSLVVLSGAILFAPASLVRADNPTADQMYEEINAIKPPAPPTDRNDRAAIDKFLADRSEVVKNRAAKVNAMFKAYPDDARLVKLMPETWMAQLMTGAAPKELKGSLDAAIAHKSNAALVKEASYIQAVMVVREADEKSNPDDLIKAVDGFKAVAGKDPRVAMLLYQVADTIEDTGRKKALFDTITKDYPDSPVVKRIEAARRQVDGIGKPFDLEFTDAIKGSQVSIKGLKGKVVVVDFWATWCGPCVEEMPKMKKIYAEYKDKGVEFIGISLDQPKEQGGLDKLKAFVSKNDIQWPQYYQGNFWQSEFSSSWGINGIPCVFLVDADGNLASVNARGKLETMIPEYLKKAHADLK